MNFKVFLIKVFINLFLIKLLNCSVVGINYMDNLKTNALKIPAGEDPCNPLYWYPRNIPDYCKYKVPEKPYNGEITPVPVTPEPIAPAPLPPAPPIILPIVPPPPMLPVPIAPALPVSPPLTMIGNPAPVPMIPMPRLPYSLSPLNPVLPRFNLLTSPNSLPYYSDPRPQAGMVPGLDGIVTKDGGINIMPFSDVYADMLEKHKNKLIRRKLYKILDGYEKYPHINNYNLLRKYGRYFTDDE